MGFLNAQVRQPWRRWARSLALSGGLMCALAAGGAVAFAAPSAPVDARCAVPDALLQSGEKQEARKAYVALLKRDPHATCASKGLKGINASAAPARPPCTSADDKFKAGDLDGARSAYLGLGKDETCATDGLTAVTEVERFCAAGQGYLDQNRNTDALADFKSALEKSPKAGCGVSGVQTASKAEVKRLCDRGDAYLNSHRESDALTTFKSALDKDPIQDCAKDGVKKVTAAEVQRLCDQGKALLSRHRSDDALTAYKAALEKGPNTECAKNGVRDAGPGWFFRSVNWLNDEISNLLVAVGVVVACFFLVLLSAYIPSVRRGLYRVRWVGSILVPRISIKTLADEAASSTKVGAPLTARIIERLHWFREQATTPGLAEYDLDVGRASDQFADIVSGDAGLKSALDKVRDVSDHTKVVTGLIDFLYALLPIRQLSLSGVIGPPLLAGASTTLSLEADGRLQACMTLTGAPLTGSPTAADYLELADPAAVWAQYAIARTIQEQPFTSTEAESYALVREGMDRHLDGQETLAEAAFEQAVEVDPFNWAARVNLALTQARLATKYPAAIQTLTDAIEMMESVRARRARGDGTQ